ncbi:uncharacterized protein [Triticum aestivum]|uniref:uncharacterized protein isoform X2 n=1 Tax=Triticum aestivum TaxID=4565 RepID=UPI001D019682|nr:uncharacterized protein LOC123189188 isoform X2 [Triticum aestivum]
MGNAKSKDGEHQLEEVVPTGQISGTNHEEYNATLIPFDELDGANYATEPAPSSETNIKESNSSIVNVSGNVDPIYTTETAPTSETNFKESRASIVNVSENVDPRYTTETEWLRVGYHADGQTEPANLTELKVDTEDVIASKHHETITFNIECKKYADNARAEYNARKRAAYRIKRNQDIISSQNENQPVVGKSDHRDHINARRRAAYRNKLSDVLGNQQVIGKSASRQSLSDITNVLENRESTKPNVQDVNALAPQSSDNPANSNYPALSHDASTFSISTAGLSGLVNENESQVANQYYTQETEDRTEAERKRDHRNALRRASYRRKKLPNVLDGNAKTLVVTDNPTSLESFPSSNTLSTVTICDTEHQDTQEADDKTEAERKRDHRNALRRASYLRKKQSTVQVEHAHNLRLSGTHTGSNYTSLSNDASALPDSTEVSTGIVNDIELQDGILNDIHETNERTEEERKRDHRNALRRAAYRRNKDKRIHDRNNNASATSGCRCELWGCGVGGWSLARDSTKVPNKDLGHVP